MPIEIREKQQSRQHRGGTTVSSRRAFHVIVTDANGNPDDLIPNDVFAAPDAPQPGDPHPDAPNLFATDFEAEREDRQRHIGTLTVDYRVGEGGFPNLNTVDRETVSRAHFDSFFRTAPNLNVPVFGIVSEPFQDIGGERVDINGHPANFLRHQQSMLLVEVRSGQPDDAFYSTFVATRNSTPFFDHPIGKIVYVGASTQTLAPNIYRATHEFVSDDLFHLVQMPLTESNRDAVALVDFGDEDPITGQAIKRAAAVFWRQPYSIFSDFSLISPLF